MAFNIGKFAAQMPANRPVTIETVTEEILDLKRDWAENTFYIGQHLNEAKELLPHGEWLPWLEEKVQFSQRTAQKFMQLAREYEGNPHMVAELGSEKAFALLALPEEEREQIAEKGAVVDGKTKPAADLTKRDIQKIVQERKAEPEKPQSSSRSAQEYLREREEEDERFRNLLWRFRSAFADCLRVCDTRQDGIYSLKERFKYAASSGPNGGWNGSPKGLTAYGSDRKRIERTWTEVWDHLAVIALQDAGYEKT